MSLNAIVRTRINVDIPVDGQDLAAYGKADAMLATAAAGLAEALGVEPSTVEVIARPMRIKG